MGYGERQTAGGSKGRTVCGEAFGWAVYLASHQTGAMTPKASSAGGPWGAVESREGGYRGACGVGEGERAAGAWADSGSAASPPPAPPPDPASAAPAGPAANDRFIIRAQLDRQNGPGKRYG